MTQSATLGFPRIGARRELKQATEAHWKNELDEAALRRTGAELRAANWRVQKEAGIDVIPSNDFSFYDHVLDAIATVGAVPARFDWNDRSVDLATYFAMARGTPDAPAMEMTKWFDTNYHYIVPEFVREQRFALSSTKALDEFREARALGIHTRPVLLGPVTLLALGKAKEPGVEPLELVDSLAPVYAELLSRLGEAGADWVQMDEPVLVLDLSAAHQRALAKAYDALAGLGPRLMLATYFGDLRDNLSTVAELPVDGLHVDLKRGPDQLDQVLGALPADKVLSLGVVDGRNVWRTDLGAALAPIETAIAARGQERVQVASSCSLLHAPVDLDSETELDPELRSWLAFGRQKLDELTALSRAATRGRDAAAAAFAKSDAAAKSRRASARVRDDTVRARLAGVSDADLARRNPYAVRRREQQAHIDLPPFPATTIGSFPQTREVRQKRAAYRRGDLSAADYEAFLRAEIEQAVRLQERLGLDVLVHGEFERNDMVEYFGEQLDGFAFTRHGWVQSYGSRYVKPPIIYGDVARPEPMTVTWSQYARSLTERPMKGMLTGPVTILQWSFVRDDQPRAETCRQIALAIRDEVGDLERAGISAIQIDEPALREGLPLRQSDWHAYLEWAVACFRLASSGVADRTQIHTHMCYGEFNDIMPSIAALDADVISIETSRSAMELLDSFTDFDYPNEIGPGVWDIHSPRVPPRDEMRALLDKAARVIDPAKLWVNPDCGLKTRAWEEVVPSLENMVAAARDMRATQARSA